MKSFIIALLSLSLWATNLAAQTIQSNAEVERNFRDSLALHENSDKLYEPHRCQNRYGYYGFVGKNHQTIVPFEYSDIEPRIFLTAFNTVRKNNAWGAIDAQGKIIVPTKYFSIHTLKSDSLYALREKSNEPLSIINGSGKTILKPSFSQVWMLNKDTIAGLPMSQQEVQLYALDGSLIGKLPYAFIIQLPNGNFKVTQRKLELTKLVSYEGIISRKGEVLIPLDYTYIGWYKGDWARVINHQKKQGGLFQISTQTFTPLDYYHIGEVNDKGVFIFGVGQNWEQAKFGLMNTKWETLLPAAYKLSPIQHSSSYVLYGGRNRNGIANHKGEIILDTLYYEVHNAIYTERKTQQNAQGQWYIERDTLPFRRFQDPSAGWGLWHTEKGILEPAVHQGIKVVDKNSYIVETKDSCRWLTVDGKTLLGPNFRMHKVHQQPFVQVQATWDEKYAWHHLDGTLYLEFPAEPSYVCEGFFAIGKWNEKRLQRFALMDTKGQLLTGYDFEERLQQIRDLSQKGKAAYAKDAIQNGKGAWIAWAYDTAQTVIQLVDAKGNIKTLPL